jgi:cell division protein FtsA
VALFIYGGTELRQRFRAAKAFNPGEHGMFRKKNCITAIEIGTSKVCVLIGESDGEGNIQVKGHGESSGHGAVCKGEISDMNAVLELLTAAVDEADNLAGRDVIDSENIFIAVTGSEIFSSQGVGNVFITSDDRRISEENVSEAVKAAQIKPLPRGHTTIGTFDSYFQIDGCRRIRNPIDQVADKLEAYIHMIHGDENRIENFLSAVRDVGFDDGVIPVFSGVASAFGTMTEEEKESGVLLVEMGAGTTEYLAVYNYGILLSGIIPVGLDHVANDLAIGLDLHISQARRMLDSGEYYRLKQAGRAVLELKNASGGTRKIPINSIEKIVDMRLREIFAIINESVKQEDVLLNTGGILSGGAALLPQALDIYKNVFELPVRVGRPLDLTGASSNLDSPRYSTVWGLLKYGDDLTRAGKAGRSKGFLDKSMDFFDGLWRPVFRNISEIKNAIKF